MRESLGNSLLLNIVIVFSGIVILFFIGIISYSKAYKVKNRIIEVIEEYNGYTTDTKGEINDSLKQIGYSVTSKDYCNSGRVRNHMDDIGGTYINVNIASPYSTGEYNYCVFEVTNKSSDVVTYYGASESKYYVVVTFVHFDFPIIGDMLNIPVYGETKILGRDYDY